ncbi:lipocalin family protein [Pseudomonas fontis]|uniref:Outer membrane lipoprotein Blc n=1 Tax=Pseudomonas fontis TaxID=2942633 RepID=A0ABT5NX58_9PSED|nr:lipocalin family protein [Pseudomonas fontis]MDD0977236.1 lipocalin family protein [Pseudomonas fontis]MDD0992769.1 lipocalin family protein [Pseudomonas fontis]
MTALRLLLGLCAGLLLTACAHTGDGPLDPKTAGNVDLKRYQGTWYEMARLPMFFQRDCAQSEAHYTLTPDGDVAVLNKCRTLQGEWQQATGTATLQVPGKTDKLWVVFDNWVSRVLPIKGDYWVLYVDSEYQTALVGNPDRKYLWILSRKPVLPALERESLLAKARQQGYDTTRLIWRVSDRDIARKP